MGLDIYSGTFVRYYAKNWKTKTQQICEENGIQYNVVRANPEEHENQASVDIILEGVSNWQNQMIKMLAGHNINSFELWEENNSKAYYTDKPDWDALGALLLMTSAKVLDRSCPKEYEKGSDFHPYIYEATEKILSEWSLFLGAYHFIPQKECLMFKWVLANGKETLFATTANLKEELNSINKLLWNADEETILLWNTTEGYPLEGTINNGKAYLVKETHIYETESLAKFCFSILYQAVKFSDQNNVPIIFDY